MVISAVQRLDARPLVIGHRGASGYRPEHSAAAYELAFELGADCVEPDVVATRDGVLVIRHENEISGTTDVAGHPEFAGRRRTASVDGVTHTGWFTEDFTWAELQTLRCVERLPALRPGSAAYDGHFGILRLSDLFSLVERAADAQQRPLGIVAEIKHATHFARLGLPLDELFAAEVEAAGWNSGDGRLVVESFEPTVLERVRARGVLAPSVLLVEAEGVPADLVAARGASAADYASFLTPDGLRGLSVEGISVPKQLLLHPGSRLVDSAHGAGLEVFTWTLRPENEFLDTRFRVGADEAAWGAWRDEFSRVMASGVDGVFADHPDLAVAVRAEFAGR
ncbi:glycerophosphodiester phosphodiesterase family protein [Subtercola endophyticus]|uniref:glycerophosphodiester phosphodiesterase family protein n=1 Tax=Subtercola endophyticus TaxID=2895559 RepID=UPI001E3742B2|nr:glycerophosphodiester phosphodiesterase family protein [Subtercola endophyticus]UFS59388.1 glycerophosphodiester phosphodiesterase [Subtercola endophyticus]